MIDPSDEEASSSSPHPTAAMQSATDSRASRNGHKGGQFRQPTVLGFQVQFTVEHPNRSLEEIRQVIMGMSQCLLIEGDAQRLQVNAQVFDPGAPLSFAIQLGHVTEIVVNNLDAPSLQHETQAEEEIVIDTVAQNGAPRLTSEPQTESTEPPLPAYPLEETIALVAVAPDAGFSEIFRKLGATVIAGNPSAEDLVAAICNLPYRRVIVLPNSGQCVLAAQQAAQTLEQAGNPLEVVVLPSKTAPQGIAAALVFRPTDEDAERMVAHMQERMGLVDTGEVAQAVYNDEFDGVSVEVGDFIGLHNGRLVTCNQNPINVVLSLLVQMAADESGLITLYYGDFISVDVAENLIEIVRAHYPEQDVELAYGGQAHCHYILSTE